MIVHSDHEHTLRLYGANIVTPNMHMDAHLASCVLDYGPLHGFWLYAFERYNGILGSFPNSNRSINYFSLLAIADILGDGEHLECWRDFVLASRILCSKQLTREKIQLADALLMQFCCRSLQSGSSFARKVKASNSALKFLFTFGAPKLCIVWEKTTCFSSSR